MSIDTKVIISYCFYSEYNNEAGAITRNLTRYALPLEIPDKAAQIGGNHGAALVIGGFMGFEGLQR